MATKLIVLLFLCCAGLSLTITEAQGNSFVQFDYNISTVSRARSTLFIELFDDRPQATANFLQYVNSGLYNSSLMHQLIVSAGAPPILRGGGYYPQYVDEPATVLRKSLNPNFKVDLDSNYSTPNPTVSSEFNNSPLRSNVKGTIAMMQVGIGPSPNSAANEYFFNLADNSATLDFANGGYTVFAKVAGDGMSLIDTYANQIPIRNLNPDINDDGTPDSGPFDSVPVLFGSNSFLPLIVNQAKAIEYLGSGLATDVPAGGLTFANKDVFIDTGASFTGTGALTIGVNRKLGVRENYVINRTVINRGTLAPGLSLGVIGIYGEYQQFFDGTLSLQFGGTAADTLYDKLIVNGAASLAGTLQVTLTNGFTPSRGDSFAILSSATRIYGDFDAYDLPNLDPGQAWKISQSTTSISLTIVQGDYNHDGIINTGDYVVWRKMLNTSTTAWAGADGNGDGTINSADFLVWRNNVNAVAGGYHTTGTSVIDLTNVSIPEPASGLLVSSAFLSAIGLRQRRKRNRK